MNKRELKKRLNYSISGAIDLVNLSGDPKSAQSKTEELLALYENMIKEINNARLLPDTKSKKAHFKKIKTDFNDKISKMFDGL